MFRTRETNCTNPECGKPVYYLAGPGRVGGGYVHCMNCGSELYGIAGQEVPNPIEMVGDEESSK